MPLLPKPPGVPQDELGTSSRMVVLGVGGRGNLDENNLIFPILNRCCSDDVTFILK